MNTVQIICLIGIILVSFIIGRATKKTKIPILGVMEFSESGEPHLRLTGFEEIKKQNFFVIKVISRQNQHL